MMCDRQVHKEIQDETEIWQEERDQHVTKADNGEAKTGRELEFTENERLKTVSCIFRLRVQERHLAKEERVARDDRGPEKEIERAVTATDGAAKQSLAEAREVAWRQGLSQSLHSEMRLGPGMQSPPRSSKDNSNGIHSTTHRFHS